MVTCQETTLFSNEFKLTQNLKLDRLISEQRELINEYQAF